MNFIKGMVMGTMISAGVIMMCVDTKCVKGKMMKHGKRMMKTIKNMY